MGSRCLFVCRGSEWGIPLWEAGEYLCIGGVSWGYSSVESLVLNGLTVCHAINLRVAMTGICWVACKRGM